MKNRRVQTICILALVLTIFGWGLASVQKDHQKDKPKSSTADYKITGTIDPVPGQSIPKSWGRLVNYVFDPRRSDRKLFVFEAEDGTIRMVRMKLDWGSHLIDDAEVITIGRN
ncbi:MAG: hypothetical protein AABN34_10385 [Acidobacteriota bacterium]